MKNFLHNHLQISFSLTLIALAIILGTWVAHNQKERFEEEVMAQLNEQRAYMFSLIEITDRNGADETISNIVADCPRRNDYEALLIKLDGLSKRDLITVQNLFESCGNFYAERKALMVAKLEREYEIYTMLTTLLTTLSTKDIAAYEVGKWNELIALEKARSTFLTDQSVIQEKIITALISGSSVTSSEVSVLLQDAQEIGQLLTVHDQKIDEMRQVVTH